MFKYPTNFLFFSLILSFSSPILADVHKWKDANGNTHYGDTPPIAGTTTVKTDKQTDDQIANGKEILTATTKFLTEEARKNERMQREREQAAQADERKRRETAFRENMRRRIDHAER